MCTRNGTITGLWNLEQLLYKIKLPSIWISSNLIADYHPPTTNYLPPSLV